LFALKILKLLEEHLLDELAKPVVTGPITSLINKSIGTSIFPDQLKVAQVKPLFKNKNYQLDKTNYRPVSVQQKCHRNQLLFSSPGL
jgi:hypothetical protein